MKIEEKKKEGGGGGSEGEEENTDHVTNTILSCDFLGQNLTPFLKNKIIGKILDESVFSSVNLAKIWKISQNFRFHRIGKRKEEKP
jgi:hypothetical protein